MIDFSEILEVYGSGDSEWADLVGAEKMILWLKGKGIDFGKLRGEMKVVEKLPDKERMRKELLSLGFSADEPILVLVWLLNKMGVETCQSCGGHVDRMLGRPLLTFSELEAIKMAALIENWEGIKGGDVVFSRMLVNEEGDKNLMNVNFMGASLEEGRKLVDELVLYLVSGEWRM